MFQFKNYLLTFDYIEDVDILYKGSHKNVLKNSYSISQLPMNIISWTISFVYHQQVLIFVFKQIFNLFICLLITGNNIIKIRF